MFLWRKKRFLIPLLSRELWNSTGIFLISSQKKLCCWYSLEMHQFVWYEPAHDKSFNKGCVTSKDSDQPVHPPSMARVLAYPSLNSQAAVEGTCHQQRLIRLHGCAGWWVFAGLTSLTVGSMVCWLIICVCVEVLQPSQPNGVMSSSVSLPNHTFTGKA